MIRYILIYTCCLFLAVQGGINAQEQNKLLDKVVAQVGSELILLSDIEEKYSYMKSRQQRVPEHARCVILENMLAQNLLINQAKIDSVVVSEEEVNAQLDARIERTLQLMGNDEERFEEYYGQSVEQVRERFRKDMRNQLLAERMRNKVLQDVSATPAEVVEYYNTIPKDSLPYFKSEVEISEIVYEPKVNPQKRQEAIDRLKELRKRIVEKGESFSEIASTYSDDINSARNGGDLGWQKRGSMVPSFEAAAYNLDEGEVSEVVETPFGFHLIKLLERRGNRVHCQHVLIEPELSEQDMREAKQLMDSVQRLLSIDSMNFERAVKQYSDEDRQSYHNGGRMVNQASGNTFFEVEDLEPDVYFTIDTMEVGEISEPFKYQTREGDTYYRMIKLESRTEPHQASLDRDYSKIKQAATEQKKQRLFTDWIQDKISSTYIEIDPKFRVCENISSMWIDAAEKTY